MEEAASKRKFLTKIYVIGKVEERKWKTHRRCGHEDEFFVFQISEQAMEWDKIPTNTKVEPSGFTFESLEKGHGPWL